MSTVDIFNGEVLNVWKDEETVYLSFPWVTIHIPLETFFECLLDDFADLLDEMIETDEEEEFEG